MKKIILASTSPRRRELLKILALPFEAVKSGYEEDNNMPVTPDELVVALAKGKASAVASEYNDAIVIGVDTVVSMDGKMYGKPKDRDDAYRMLKEFNNTQHKVISGYYLIDTSNNVEKSGLVQTVIKFKNNSDEELRRYANSADVLDKAGAYDLEDKGIVFLENLNGDFYNSIGLPLTAIAEELKELGIEVV